MTNSNNQVITLGNLNTLMPLHDQTRRSQVADQLRKLIVSGNLDPGERLIETELAYQLGVSRGPLREALRNLVDEGLLISVPYKGVHVRTVSKTDFQELYSLRVALESMALSGAWPKRTTADLDELKKRNDILNDIIQKGDEQLKVIEHELNFHNWAFEVCGHNLLHQHWLRLVPNVTFYYAIHQNAHGRARTLLGEHDYFTKIACGDDLNLLLNYLKEHLYEGMDVAMELLPD